VWRRASMPTPLTTIPVNRSASGEKHTAPPANARREARYPSRQAWRKPVVPRRHGQAMTIGASPSARPPAGRADHAPLSVFSSRELEEELIDLFRLLARIREREAALHAEADRRGIATTARSTGPPPA